MGESLSVIVVPLTIASADLTGRVPHGRVPHGHAPHRHVSHERAKLGASINEF
jgi:hypothetical protein